jgi:hypothetical protein
VTVDAQNRLKLGHRRPCQTVVSADDTQREREHSKRLKLTDSRHHVTVDAQNRLKLGHRRPFQTVMSADDTQRERQSTASD